MYTSSIIIFKIFKVYCEQIKMNGETSMFILQKKINRISSKIKNKNKNEKMLVELIMYRVFPYINDNLAASRLYLFSTLICCKRRNK